MEVQNKIFERVKGGITIGIGMWLLLGILAEIEATYHISEGMLSVIQGNGNELDLLYVLISGTGMLVVVCPAAMIFILNLVLGMIMLISKKQVCSQITGIIYAVFMCMVSVVLLWLFTESADTELIRNLFFYPVMDLAYMVWGIVSGIITFWSGRKGKAIQK